MELAMDKCGEVNSITVTKNHWCVPNEARAFDGWMEGRPTEMQKQEVLEAARIARAAWKPSDEGFELVEQLKGFVGSRVQVQFWDPIMFMLEDEGPFPIQADLVKVMLQEDEGFLQAYLVLTNFTEISTKDGYSAMGFIGKTDSDGNCLASLADIYRISRDASPRMRTSQGVGVGRTK
jgi:hypothetical protein